MAQIRERIKKNGKKSYFVRIRLNVLIHCKYWWPEVELNHRHTDYQSVDLKPQLTDIKLYTLLNTSSVELM